MCRRYLNIKHITVRSSSVLPLKVEREAFPSQLIGMGSIESENEKNDKRAEYKLSIENIKCFTKREGNKKMRQREKKTSMAGNLKCFTKREKISSFHLSSSELAEKMSFNALITTGQYST